MCSMCAIWVCSPSQISPSFTLQGGLVGLVAGTVVVAVEGKVVVVVAGIVVASVVVPSVPSVVVGMAVVVVCIMVVPIVVSGMGGHGHSEKEGELGPQMQSGHSSTKSQLREFIVRREGIIVRPGKKVALRAKVGEKVAGTGWLKLAHGLTTLTVHCGGNTCNCRKSSFKDNYLSLDIRPHWLLPRCCR